MTALQKVSRKFTSPGKKLLAYPLFFSVNIIMTIIIIYLPVTKKKSFMLAGWRLARLPIESELRVAVV